MHEHDNPWPALWALCLGFFMILVDSTIVSVATPAIMTGLHADINAAVWVTSAYLLAYAVPLLVTGRLGDRFGPKNLYLAGLVVFTLSSVWCGLSHGIEALIVARVFQGIGAALITPQTMTVITRIFPPERRGTAMGVWGSVAGVATLVGPLVGGVLVDSLGWEWIFFVNVPVGILGLVLAVLFVPRLPTHAHRFDIPGVVVSALGLFCLVFGLQEGQRYHWGTIWGPVSAWLLIGAGLALLAAFVVWQHRNTREPLMPLRLFRDRNFSLSNLAITTMGFSVTAMMLPIMLFAQEVRGFSPTQAALLMAPMAVISGVLAPVIGRLVDRVHPRYIATPSMLLFAAASVWLGLVMRPDVAVWKLLLPTVLMGVGSAGIWSPLSASATRNLPRALAGAGSGVYNTTRQIGAVLGSAAIAVVMESRLAAQGLPAAGAAGGGGRLPAAIHQPFSTAMGQSMWLPAIILLIGVAATACYARPGHQGAPGARPEPTSQGQSSEAVPVGS
jgi:EmrB/QacA subfamily drug resistance transporter